VRFVAAFAESTASVKSRVASLGLAKTSGEHPQLLHDARFHAEPVQLLDDWSFVCHSSLLGPMGDG